MKAFQYATAHSTDSARELVAGNGAYLAGGNDLLGLLKEYLITADTLVNIKSLPRQDRARERFLDDWRTRHRRADRARRGHKKSFPRPA
jgi:CO/xanthine dehydrogenase FAD-binding subunit